MHVRKEKTINMISKYKSSTEYHIKLSNTIGSELSIGLPKSGLLKRFKRLNKINNTEIKYSMYANCSVSICVGLKF